MARQRLTGRALNCEEFSVVLSTVLLQELRNLVQALGFKKYSVSPTALNALTV